MIKGLITFQMILVAVVFLATDIFSQNYFENGEIGVTLSGAGRIRIYKDSTSAPRQIDRASVLVGTGPNAVFGYNQDAANEDSVRLIQNPQYSDFEIYGSANNSFANLPPNVLSAVNIYGWVSGGFTIVKYSIVNRETFDIDAVIGMELIAQINGSYGLESIKWINQEKIISIYRIGEAPFVGFKLFSEPLTTLSIFDWYGGYDTVDTDLWGWLTENTIDTLFDSGGDGAVSIFSKDAVNIAVGDTSTMWVGISVGTDEAEMVANMSLAEDKYELITVGVERDNSTVPSEYLLSQNYPNPFNPSTGIKFSIPNSDFVSLKVYDLLGKEVATLVNEELTAGSYQTTFEGSSLPSGVYFYTIRTNNFKQTRKMNLIK